MCVRTFGLRVKEVFLKALGRTPLVFVKDLYSHLVYPNKAQNNKPVRERLTEKPLIYNQLLIYRLYFHEWKLKGLLTHRRGYNYT